MPRSPSPRHWPAAAVNSIDVAMAAVAASYAALPVRPSESDCAAPPPAATDGAHARAAELGADNALVDRMVAERRLGRMLIQRARLLDGTVVDIRAEQRIIDVAERLTPIAGRGGVRRRAAAPSSPACTITTSTCIPPPRH